ncbi:MAG TPA: DUF3891 family protein [Miltoncostaeaceae bacterium]|nr:DUF3891 family protein [Miltoncostaeaceae bacterium]
MIVSRRPEGLLLVRQVDHQVQCAAFAEAWGNAVFARPAPWAPLVVAAAVHDEGWRAWEAAPQVGDDGAPVDFPHIDRPTHVALYREAIAGAAGRDPRAGLIVSMHGQGLYEGRLGLDQGPATPRRARPPAVKAFLAEQDTLQGALRERIGAGPDLDAWAWAGYRLLQTWDVLSLHLTWRAQAAGRATVLPQVPRAAGDPGVTLTVRPLGPLEATCDPWPFAGAEVAVPVRVRVIADRPYASDADLQGALRAAPWETRAYTLSRPGT